MKKIAILIILIGGVAGLGYYAYTLSQSHGTSDSELIEFAINDVSTVNRVKITDKFGNEFEVVKDGESWTSGNGTCVTKEKVDWMLDAFKNITFKGYLADSSLKTFTNQMAAQHIKVEIFQNDEWTKTWYIGPATQDHYGQIMLLDSKEYGKSAYPVMMELKNMKGIIEPRFYADPYKWMCTDIFRIPLEKIKSVRVKFNDEPQRSFRVTKNGQEIKVYQQDKLLEGVNQQQAYRYLNNYEKIHWETANYVLDEKQVDSLKKTTPFCEMWVSETTGSTTKLRLFRITTNQTSEQAGMGEVINQDLNNFWCELPDGALVKCQYFVFNPLILGHQYFPFDMSEINTIDGMRSLKEEENE